MTQDQVVEPALARCRASVADAGPTSSQRRSGDAIIPWETLNFLHLATARLHTVQINFYQSHTSLSAIIQCTRALSGGTATLRLYTRDPTGQHFNLRPDNDNGYWVYSHPLLSKPHLHADANNYKTSAIRVLRFAKTRATGSSSVVLIYHMGGCPVVIHPPND